MSKFLDGIKFGLGFILILALFLGIVYAAGFHSASEILGGVFQGNYIFNGTVNFENATLAGVYLPNNVTFDSKSDVELGTIIYSNNVTMSGFLGTQVGKILGSTNASFIKNGIDTNSTIVSFQPGDLISIKTRSPND